MLGATVLDSRLLASNIMITGGWEEFLSNFELLWTMILCVAQK